MRVITIQNTLGDEVSLRMPESPDEVPVSKFIDYSTSFQKFVGWYNDMAERGELVQNRSMYVYELCKIISEYFDVNLNTLIHYDISELLDEEGQLRVDIMSDHAGKMGEAISDMDEVEDVLLTVALTLNHVVNGYEPKLRTDQDHKFTYKGESWVLPKVNVLAGAYVHYPKFTVKEIVECMEIQRLSAKQRSKDQSPDNGGSALLTEYLSMFAILCRKEGEDIDLDVFDELVEARLHHFIDLDMRTVRDLVFFSEVTLTSYVQNLIQDSFSTLQNERQETQPKAKRLVKQRGEVG